MAFLQLSIKPKIRIKNVLHGNLTSYFIRIMTNEEFGLKKFITLDLVRLGIFSSSIYQLCKNNGR
jgi:hypothetical protein